MIQTLPGCAGAPQASSEPPPAYGHAEFGGRIGVAREDITAPVGIYARNWGAAKHDVAEGIHRPLTATVLTLQEGEGTPPLALAALDLGWWKTLEDENYVRHAVLEALKVDAARVMVNLSHTHAGPAICREDSGMPGGHLIAPYLDKVRDGVVRAARRALEGAFAGTLTWKSGRCDLAHNRDLKDPARDRYACGFNPRGAADDLVLVGRAADAAGRTRAVIVNYACHPTVLAWENRLLSPDYPGAMREVVESHVPDALCLYLHGASGDVAACDQYTGDVSLADRHGRQLGYAALSTLEGMLPPATRLEFAGVVESGAPLATWKRVSRKASSALGAVRVEVELPLKTLPSVAELAEQLKATPDRVMAERVRRKIRVRRIVGEGTVARIPMWVWRAGDGFLVGQPNEAYSPFQTELRKRFPGSAIAAMNLVNGAIGYLPPAPLHGLDLYQVWQTPFERGCLERATGAAAEALERLGAR
jgi:hypothetical protein